MVLDAMCGPVGVGVQAACRGVGLKRAQWNGQDGGVSMIGGLPLGRRPRALARPTAEPAHCFVYKSPPFLLFLLSPSPHLPPFLNSSQTTPAFRLSGGRANWWAGAAQPWVGAAGGEVGEVPGQKGGGRAVWGRAAILASCPSPRAGAAPCVLLDGRDRGKGGGAGDWTGWEGEAWERWGLGRRGVSRSSPWGG